LTLAAVPVMRVLHWLAVVHGGRLIVIDVIAPEMPLFDASHVRDHRVSEWGAIAPLGPLVLFQVTGVH
jgi:hypothetical protein